MNIDQIVKARLSPFLEKATAAKVNGSQTRFNPRRRVILVCNKEIEAVKNLLPKREHTQAIESYRKAISETDPDHYALRYFWDGEKPEKQPEQQSTFRPIVRERLNAFLDRVRVAKTNGDQKRYNILRRVFTVCRQEVDFLLDKYSATFARTIITDYRKAIRLHDGDHIALRYFKLDRAAKGVSDEIEREYSRQIIGNLSTLKLIENPDELIKNAKLLLLSDSYQTITAGLLLLTGRRPAEILKTAVFKHAGGNWLTFKGQLKTKGEERDVYNIPCLCSPSLVIAALSKIREATDFSALSPDGVHNRCSSNLAKLVKQKLGNYKLKDLRSMYAAMSEAAFSSEGTDWIISYSNFLGHKILREEDNSYSASSLQTALSYRRYRTPDGWPKTKKE